MAPEVNSGSAPVGVLVRCRPLLKEARLRGLWTEGGPRGPQRLGLQGSRIKLSASSAKSGKAGKREGESADQMRSSGR